MTGREVALTMLETDRLILRKMTTQDTDDLLHIFSDPKVMQSFGGVLFGHESLLPCMIGRHSLSASLLPCVKGNGKWN